MNIMVKEIQSGAEIGACFDVFSELRPHLTDPQSFIEQVLSQQKEGYNIVAILEGQEIAACIGFREITTLAWGKVLYIDDLITREKSRDRGYGAALLAHATAMALERGCDQIHLDTGYHRHAAHKAYLKAGFEINSHHMAKVIRKGQR